MKNDFNEYLKFHKENGGTGKLFKFKFLEYKPGFLKVEGEFNAETLNPSGTVQGGQMNSMLDDITSLLLIYESNGKIYPNSTNLHSLHHRPLHMGPVIATAQILKKGKSIATVKGELYNSEGKLAATLLHTAVIMKSDFKENIN